MKLLVKKIGLLSILLLTGIVITVGFQNCSRTQFSAAKTNSSLSSSGTNFCVLNPNDTACTTLTPIVCTFNGSIVANGQSVTAYQNSSGVCTSEKRICTDGQLSGSFNYATCSPSAPKSCLFDGKTIDSGKSIKAYLNSNVDAGSQCQSENRICTDGVLSGSYSYGSCTVNAFAGCLFNGQTIAHGGTVTAYQNSSVASGQTCKSEVRQCANGDLTGTFNFGSCTVAQPGACTFNGQTIAHGQTVTAFLASTVPSGQTCQSQVRTCNNGVLSGTNSFASCKVAQPAACTFNGQTVASGASVLAYLNGSVTYGASCAQESRICTNGVLSGSYTFANCSTSAAANCQFNGVTIAHGQTVKSFLASTVAFGQTCQEQTRTCNNGALSGTYSFASCAVGAAASCNFNNQTVAHGATVTGFQSSAVAYGQACVSETKTCNNGTLSGGYNFASCTVGAAASCNFNGQTVVHGQTVTAFEKSAVAAGTTTQACNWQSPAVFGGGYGCRAYSPTGSCPYAGATSSGYSCLEMRPSGDVWTSFSGSMRCVCSQTTTGAESCKPQTRTCTNGVLSGTFAYSSCSATDTNPVPQNQSCTFNGQTIAHGAGVTAYAASSVAAGQTCASQYRTCNNGSLSGNYTASSCVTQQAASCNFNGQVIPSGGAVTAYASSSVAYGQTCSAQTRYCTNGSLSGTYGSSSCSTQQAASCSTQQSGVLYCGSKTLCPDGKEVFPATTMTTTGTIYGVAHGQYSNVTSTGIGSATNVRYRCDQGTFIWDPPAATSCTAPVTNLPASDARCKKSCTPFRSDARCFIKEVCPNGIIPRQNQLSRIDTMNMSVNAAPGQVVTVGLANLSGIPSNIVIHSFTWPVICDENGSGVWREYQTGNCNATLTLPASDARCQVYYGSDGG